MNSIINKLFWPLIFFAVLYLSFTFWPSKKIIHSPGVLVNKSPEQIELENETIFEKDGYLVTAKAKYNISARILSIESYGSGRESDLSPLDFALGWGPMSDQSVLDKIDISQRRRWYYWKAKHLPIPRRSIEVNSANTHIIPATDNIEDKLDELYVGNVVELSGYLVYIKADDGWRWKSSLSRDDTGNGACEVFWVEEVKTIK